MRHPQNQTVLAGQDVLLACQVGGDPQPDIHWRRKEADINLNKGNIEVTEAWLLSEEFVIRVYSGFEIQVDPSN